jgi:hypothetical protein
MHTDLDHLPNLAKSAGWAYRRSFPKSRTQGRSGGERRLGVIAWLQAWINNKLDNSIAESGAYLFWKQAISYIPHNIGYRHISYLRHGFVY